MDFTIIFETFLALVATIITAFLIPYIKSKTNTEQQGEISMWIDIAVSAAEQLFDSTQGAEKLEYVVNFLEDLGIEVTSEQIESAVYWLHSAFNTESEVNYETTTMSVN